jgi:MoxR-like ATPase
VQPVATKEEILRMRHVAREVPIAESVLDFGLNLIVATRPNESKVPAVQKYLRYGSSPRGAQCLVTAARIFALLDGRFNVSKEDLKQASLPVLRHRIGLNFEAEADSITQDKIISDVILGVERQDRDPIRV